jgi:hypothetical protein
VFYSGSEHTTIHGNITNWNSTGYFEVDNSLGKLSLKGLKNQRRCITGQVKINVKKSFYIKLADFTLIRSNKLQQYAGIYLVQNHSTCFGYLSLTSSGVHKRVTAASGTGHSI